MSRRYYVRVEAIGEGTAIFRQRGPPEVSRGKGSLPAPWRRCLIDGAPGATVGSLAGVRTASKWYRWDRKDSFSSRRWVGAGWGVVIEVACRFARGDGAALVLLACYLVPPASPDGKSQSVFVSSRPLGR